MGKSGRTLRKKLFNRGNNRCPICLTQFTKESVERGESVTLEHVPPKSMRSSGFTSRLMCLTCANCNEGAGRGIDQAAHRAMKPTKAIVDVAGVPHTGTITVKADQEIDITTSGLRVPPSAVFGREPEELRVKLVFPNKHYVAVSWLKSAYLSLFSLLGKQGYRYAESTVASLIRKQIREPDQKYIPWCGGWFEQKAPGDWIYMRLTHPQCWIVKMGTLLVFLPKTGDDEFYADIRPFVVGQPFQLGKAYFWQPCRFNKQLAISVGLKDRTKLDEVTGDDPFGVSARVTTPDGSIRKCTICDYGTDYITLLPVRRHIAKA